MILTRRNAIARPENSHTFMLISPRPSAPDLHDIVAVGELPSQISDQQGDKCRLNRS